MIIKQYAARNATVTSTESWPADKISDAVLELLENPCTPYSHMLDFYGDGNYHYIYDSECYFFIFDGKIELRCDRDFCANAQESVVYKISEENDVVTAYNAFTTLLAEAEED
jgi:hypothetical protein